MRDFLDDADVPDDSLSRCIYQTPHLVTMAGRVDHLLKVRRNDSHGYAEAIVGPPRTGKTSFVKNYLRDRRDGLRAGGPLRFLYVELHGDTQAQRITHLLLDAAGDANPSFGTPAARATRLIKTLERRNYDLIVLDEVHHLVNSETVSVKERGANWIVTILNTVRTPMLLIGYASFKRVIEANPALGGRILPTPSFQALRYDDPEDQAEFRTVLGFLDENLGLSKPSGLADPDVAARICVACLGRYGFVELFLQHARLLVQERHHSCITRDILRDAADEALGNWVRFSFNPFEVPDLGAALRANGKPTLMAGEGA